MNTGIDASELFFTEHELDRKILKCGEDALLTKKKIYVERKRCDHRAVELSKQEKLSFTLHADLVNGTSFEVDIYICIIRAQKYILCFYLLIILKLISFCSTSKFGCAARHCQHTRSKITQIPEAHRGRIIYLVVPMHVQLFTIPD